MSSTQREAEQNFQNTNCVWQISDYLCLFVDFYRVGRLHVC